MEITGGRLEDTLARQMADMHAIITLGCCQELLRRCQCCFSIDTLDCLITKAPTGQQWFEVWCRDCLEWMHLIYSHYKEPSHFQAFAGMPTHPENVH